MRNDDTEGVMIGLTWCISFSAGMKRGSEVDNCITPFVREWSLGLARTRPLLDLGLGVFVGRDELNEKQMRSIVCGL